MARSGRPLGHQREVEQLRGVDFAVQPPGVGTGELCKLWSAPDLDEIAGRFTEDEVYQNIPIPPTHGHDEIRELISGFMAAFDGIDFQVHRQLSRGELVMNERTDVMRRKDDGQIALPVMASSRCATVASRRGGTTSTWRRSRTR